MVATGSRSDFSVAPLAMSRREACAGCRHASLTVWSPCAVRAIDRQLGSSKAAVSSASPPPACVSFYRQLAAVRCLFAPSHARIALVLPALTMKIADLVNPEPTAPPRSALPEPASPPELEASPETKVRRPPKMRGKPGKRHECPKSGCGSSFTFARRK